MAQMNFKDRLRKAPQEQQMNAWTKQNTLTKTNSKKDLFKTATNILSQQFEAGDLKRGQHPTQIIKKRNTSILEAQCQDDLHQQQVQQNYYNGGIVQRNNHHGSMMNSNTNTVDNYSNSLFESKLHQTKGQLCQHINDVQRRMRNQLQKQRILTQDFITRLLIKQNQKTKEQQTKNLTEIIQQLNIQLTNSGNRHKKMEAAFKQHEQKYYFLQKQFNQFTNETQQKLEKIMNNNNNVQVQGSMKKSFSRNMGTQYIIQAKNSIKDIPVLNTTLVQEIKSQIMDTQQAIKSIRYEITNIKQDLKAKIMNSLVQNQKQKQQYVQLSKIQYLTEDIANLRNQLKSLEADNGNKFDEIMRVLQTQEDNWIGMNESFHKTINNNIIPRVKKVQDQLQCQTFQKYSQHLKKQVIKELESMPIIRVKSLTQQQKQKLQRMKTLQKSQQQAYMMDQSNLILDCFGRYLLDEQNQKIRLEEQQVYYLQKIQGIEIKLSS